MGGSVRQAIPDAEVKGHPMHADGVPGSISGKGSPGHSRCSLPMKLLGLWAGADHPTARVNTHLKQN